MTRVLILLALLSLPGCAWWSHSGAAPPAYFSVGSTEKQVAKSMGGPSRITLLDDTEYWHYGHSWVAFLNNRVVKYDNKGSLLVDTVNNQGDPSGIDTPVIPPPRPQMVRPVRQINAPNTVRTKMAVLEEAMSLNATRAAPPPSSPSDDLPGPPPSNPAPDTGRGQWVN